MGGIGGIGSLVKLGLCRNRVLGSHTGEHRGEQQLGTVRSGRVVGGGFGGHRGGVALVAAEASAGRSSQSSSINPGVGTFETSMNHQK